MPLATLGKAAGVSSGFPIVDPPVAGWVGFWDARRIDAADGSKVAIWEDSGGGGYNLTQDTDANRPILRKNTLGVYPTVEFSSAVSSFSIKNTAVPQTYDATIVVLFRVTALDGVGRIILDATAGNPRLWRISEILLTANYLNGGMSVTNLGAPVVNQWYRISARYISSAQYFYSNGSFMNQQTGLSGVAPMGFTAGAGGYTSGSTMNGNIAEIIYYGTTLSEAQLVTLDQYLIDKWDLA